MRKEKILFIFNFGSEIRQFSHSGVISELLDAGNEVYISLRVVSDEIVGVLDKRIKLLPYYQQGVPFYINLIKEILDEKSDKSSSWKYLSTNKSFKNRRNKLIYTSLSTLLRFGIKFKFIEKKIFKLESKLFLDLNSQQWTDLLRSNQVDKVIVNVPNYNYPLLSSAKKINIPVYLLFHTNKDLYTLGRLSTMYAKIGVWNKDMKKELLTINKEIDEDIVNVVGCSHFTNFLDNQETNKELFSALGIEGDDIVILYIAAAPFVVQNEYDYVELLTEKLKKIGVEDYKIIVKINPMDNSDYWQEHACEKVIAMKSQWAWNKDEAFNYPEKSDIDNFISILKKSKICVGLPSTVVIESSLMKVPFLNICFEYKNVKSIYNKIVDMWSAPFYAGVVRTGAAVGVFSSDEFKRQLNDFLVKGKDIADKQEMFIKQELTYHGNMINTKTIEFLIEEV